jgi:hypothetical protein
VSSFVLILCAAVLSSGDLSAREPASCIDAPGVVCPPQTYKDSNSGLIFYVESDGRHVTAINPEGKILWTRNPFEDARLEPYRNPMPRITWIGPVGENALGKTGTFIFIRFDSSQGGVMNVETGDFTYGGRD